MIELLKTLSVPRMVMGFGMLLMAAAAVNESFFGFTIVEGTNVYIGVLGATILIVGYIGWLVMKRAETDVKIADAKLRETKIEHGADPNSDKTIVKPTEDH